MLHLNFCGGIGIQWILLCNLNGDIRAGRQMLYLGQIRIGLHGSELRLMLNGPKLAGGGGGGS